MTLWCQNINISTFDGSRVRIAKGSKSELELEAQSKSGARHLLWLCCSFGSLEFWYRVGLFSIFIHSFGSAISLFKAHCLTDHSISHLTRATCCIFEGLAVFNNLGRLTAIHCIIRCVCMSVCIGQILTGRHERGEFPFVCTRHLTRRWRRQSRNSRVIDPMLMSLDYVRGCGVAGVIV